MKTFANIFKALTLTMTDLVFRDNLKNPRPETRGHLASGTVVRAGHLGDVFSQIM